MGKTSRKYVEFVPVMETHNAGDRVFIRSILDSAGIVYYIQGETVAPYLFNSLPMTVMVRLDQVETAREVLKDMSISYSYGGRNRKPETRCR